MAGDIVRIRKEGGGGLQRETTKTSEVPKDLVNIRSSLLPDLCVGGVGASVQSKVAKKSVYSGECNLCCRMLKSPRTTSGVPCSGKQLSRASMLS